MKKRTKPRVLPIGTVSHGTMREEDVIPALIEAARSIRLSRADDKRMREIEQKLRDASAWSVLRYWDTEGATEDMVLLMDLLNSYCPPYCYFGAHEGDGSDYGCWPSQEALDNGIVDGDILCTESNGMRTMYRLAEWSGDLTEGEPEIKHLVYSYRLNVSDHGNMTLYTRKGKEVWGVV